MKFMKWIDDLLLGKKPEMKIVKSRDLGNGWYEVDGLKFKAESHAHAINIYRKACGE